MIIRSCNTSYIDVSLSFCAQVVVAAYRIGKERVFLGLARALGVKVGVITHHCCRRCFCFYFSAVTTIFFADAMQS